ncbi:hypothetical protein SAMN05446037_100689 [Anaerovirgula multivorans]|uniref:Uncharacterized protein n=1 Tax=Anaerovirgula multivorans TaxID=312168 RepID=A0A239CQP4_9FIRM|nr:hypothetical protein [Anaerovirgula multivorans]SNS22172.1 hypothetical protein SAMN05446037_100689 [Anaerovirgula multivorans]
MYEPKILTEGFETEVRSKLSVKKSELSDQSIQSKGVAGLSESMVIKRVPAYSTITDESDLMFLEAAVQYYMSYLLCLTMANRLKHKVSTIEVSWERSKVDWQALAAEFLGLFEHALANIETVEVVVPDSALMALAKMERDE